MVRDGGYPSGEAFRRMYGAADDGGREPESDEETGGGDTVGHAESAIDELSDEANANVKEEVFVHSAEIKG